MQGGQELDSTSVAALLSRARRSETREQRAAIEPGPSRAVPSVERAVSSQSACCPRDAEPWSRASRWSLQSRSTELRCSASRRLSLSRAALSERATVRPPSLRAQLHSLLSNARPPRCPARCRAGAAGIPASLFRADATQSTPTRQIALFRSLWGQKFRTKCQQELLE
jgi:hypothetical protein